MMATPDNTPGSGDLQTHAEEELSESEEEEEEDEDEHGKAEGEPKNDGSHWFDAPARDHAWWQEQKKRILLYLHPGEGLSIGQKAHRASQDIKSGAIHNTFARATLRAGREQIWLSVLVPFNEGDDASKLAKTISTELLENGTARVRIGHVKASIDALGSWRVER